ncbi:uncharacterized protein LOC106635939 [Copidosoma floridanum]|uniref:uncharacterized protein LOC106635939 n=1 Tax=Copidosoma floridanum TaxID=29053 RepID=UPI000C6F7EE2|nr:uncharacterized protein LOC106635939 [Copidosoma floridanum]
MYKWKDYWPWGRPGGGAPCAGALRKKNVPLEPPAKLSARTPRSSCFDLQLISQEQLRRTTSVRYAATDATRPGYIIDSLRSSKANCRNYAVQLVEQIRQKQAISEKEHRRDEAECRRHFDAWERLWGSRIDLQQLHRRNNLHQILYTTAGP